MMIGYRELLDFVQRLLFAMIIAYYALTLIGIAAQRAGYRKFVCKDPISAAWMALRLLKMPWLLEPRMVNRALLLYCWKFSFQTG